MRLSAHDIEHQEFQTSLSGYNRAQVREFLAKVAEWVDERLENLQKLRDEVTRQDQIIEQLRISELELKRAVVSTERLHSDIKSQAEREADLILREARARADSILKDTELQKEQLLKAAHHTKGDAEQEAKTIRKEALREAEAHKKRAQQLAETLRKQVEYESIRLKQKAEQDSLMLTQKAKLEYQALVSAMEQTRQEKQLFIEQFRAMLHVYGRNLDEIEQQLKKSPRPSRQTFALDALSALEEQVGLTQLDAAHQTLAALALKAPVGVKISELTTLHDSSDPSTQEALEQPKVVLHERWVNRDSPATVFDYNKTKVTEVPYDVQVLDTQEWFEEFANDEDIENVSGFEKGFS